MGSISNRDATTSRNGHDGSPAGLRVRVHGAVPRGVFWIGVGGFVSATAIGIGACRVVDSCADDGTCPPTLARGNADPTGGDPDAGSGDSCAGDGGCSTLAEASDAFGGVFVVGVEDGSTVDASVVDLLLGTWTLVGTERSACAAAAGLSPTRRPPRRP